MTGKELEAEMMRQEKANQVLPTGEVEQVGSKVSSERVGSRQSLGSSYGAALNPRPWDSQTGSSLWVSCGPRYRPLVAWELGAGIMQWSPAWVPCGAAQCREYCSCLCPLLVSSLSSSGSWKARSSTSLTC